MTKKTIVTGGACFIGKSGVTALNGKNCEDTRIIGLARTWKDLVADVFVSMNIPFDIELIDMPETLWGNTGTVLRRRWISWKLLYTIERVHLP